MASKVAPAPPEISVEMETAPEVAALPLSPDGGHDLHQEDLKGTFNEEAAAQEEGLLLEAAEAAEAGLAAMEGDLASGDISAADGQVDAKAEAAVGRVRAFVRPRPLPDDLLRSRGGNCIQSQPDAGCVGSSMAASSGLFWEQVSG